MERADLYKHSPSVFTVMETDNNGQFLSGADGLYSHRKKGHVVNSHRKEGRVVNSHT